MDQFALIKIYIFRDDYQKVQSKKNYEEKNRRKIEMLAIKQLDNILPASRAQKLLRTRSKCNVIF